jgi:hypothetical protein
MKGLCQLLSVLIGIVCAVLLIVGIVPLLGWSLWFTLGLCVLGIVFGAFPEKKTGLIINIAVALVAMLRLLLGGGLL